METLMEPLIQKISYARASLWAPFNTVGISVRVGAHVPEEELEKALLKLQILHPQLASRVVIDPDGSAWLTNKNVADLALEVFPWKSENDWSQVFLRYEKLPVRFERGPIARFILLQGESFSDIIGIVPHVICDGYSMCQVMFDLLEFLNFPERNVIAPPPSPEITWNNVFHSPLDNLPLRGLVRLVNFAYPNGNPVVRQEFYEKCNSDFWQRQHDQIAIFQFPYEKTSAVVDQCRRNHTSVSSALLIAFLIARKEQQPGMFKNPLEISMAVNIRNRMIKAPDRDLGVYVTTYEDKVRISPESPFWETARLYYIRSHKILKDRARMLRTLVLEKLDPKIMDSLLEEVSTDRWSRKSRIITHFVRMKGRSRCIFLSNIGKIESPGSTAKYPFVTMFPFPPLFPGGGLMVNVITVNGLMNLILKYCCDELDESAISKMFQRVEELLMSNVS